MSQRPESRAEPYLLIVAAGGYATRAFVLTGYAAKPKSLVNAGLDGRTVLEEVVCEAVDSGIRECVVVASSERSADAYERFFDPLHRDPALRTYLTRRGKVEEIEQIRRRPAFNRAHVLIQPEPRGFGDAIALAEPYRRAGDRDGRPFVGTVVALGDDVVHARTPAMRQLIVAHAATKQTIVAVQRVAREEARRFGVVVVEPPALELGATFPARMAFRVTEMQEKPPDPTPSRINGEELYLAVVGRYILNPADFEFLTQREGSVEAELDFTALLQHRARAGQLVAVELEGTWHSVGTPLDAQKAFLHYALVPPSGRPSAEQEALRAYVRALLRDPLS